MDIDFQKVLIFLAHPDDGEFMAGGSMAKWAADGKEVSLCVVTNGAMGANDPNVKRDDLIEARRAEQLEAAKITGAKEVIFLGYEDCHVEDSHELRRDMIKEIRRIKPDVVMGPDPTSFFFAHGYINHRDHRKVGEAFCSAVSPGAATVPLYREELYDKGFMPHEIKVALISMNDDPNYYVDISGHMETKLRGVMAHFSQTPEFSAGMEDRLKEWGKMSAEASGLGYEYAESFRIIYLQGPPSSPDEEQPLPAGDA